MSVSTASRFRQDCGKIMIDALLFFFSIVTLYTKNVKQIKNTISSAPITIYVVEGKLNVKKKKKKVN